MSKPTPETRQITTELSLAAPVGAVWNALTRSDEVTRWFALEARVEPKVGGRYEVSWGEGGTYAMSIGSLEPPSHLRLEEIRATPGGPMLLAVDWTLQAAGGQTLLRLVHSGFGSDASWDEEYAGTQSGWELILGTLRRYLERHPGQPRRALMPSAKTARARQEVWTRLLDLAIDPRVVTHNRAFFAVEPTLPGGVVNVEIYGTDKLVVNALVSAFGAVPERAFDEVVARWKDALDTLG